MQSKEIKVLGKIEDMRKSRAFLKKAK